jgi:two-component system chemotaxis response regulator CheY
MEARTKICQNTVAIVEDEKDLVDVYVRLCDLKDLQVSFIAYNGCEAVHIFSSCTMPDIILMDHRMPSMTGLEAMKKMLEIRPDAKFLFLSADEEVKADALKAGARAFLKKPASLMEIYNTMMKVIREP